MKKEGGKGEKEEERGIIMKREGGEGERGNREG